ncbi:haloacid dehalogenase-like hydrolase domain-containing 5 [Styela clava]
MRSNILCKLAHRAVRSSSFVKNNTRSSSSFNQKQDIHFGLLFDIDGVVLRGKKPIPAAQDAFKKIVNNKGKFRVPVVFVTNAGNALRKCKAEQLSEALNVKVSEEQVMLSHSPLRLFKQFHNKRLLLSGQGPVEDIAKNLGFTNTVTIDDVRDHFPMLDMVDHTRRPKTFKYPSFDDFPPIEGIVLFGEPIRWETNLQIITDVLLTDGTLRGPVPLPDVNKPHLPVLACNMDLQWMSETHMPRFGHGMFLQCLESVYLKLTGQCLTYSALVGKPSESTYYYAEQLASKEAEKLGLGLLQRLYAVGDNPMADIYGANLYNKKLKENEEDSAEQQAAVALLHSQQPWRQAHAGLRSRSITTSASAGKKTVSNFQASVEDCHSVLVCTGVYSQEGSSYDIPPVFHGPRDMDFDANLCQPTYITHDLNTAIDLIFDKEGFK